MIRINDDLYVDKIETIKIKFNFVPSPSLFLGSCVQWYAVVLNDKHEIYENKDKGLCEEFLKSFMKENNLDEHN